MERTKDKITIIIPAYNEEKTVRQVVQTALEVKKNNRAIHEVLLIDDGSKDKTVKEVENLDVRVISHKINRGYTAALSTGIKNAKTEFVVIIDADWRNITPEAICKIINPVLEKKADLVKASFNMERGRVTNFAVKPMMKILYPEYDFEQPISGQFAGKAEFFESVEIDNSWGIAIGILLEALQRGLKVIEVDVGELVHKARTDEDKAYMAKEVMQTMIQKAGLIRHKYKLIIFTIDDAIVSTKSFHGILKKFGLDTVNFKSGQAKPIDKIIRSAKNLEGVKNRDLKLASSKIRTSKYAKEVFSILKKRRFQTALITTNFTPIAQSIKETLGIDYLESIDLEKQRGRLTGKITSSAQKKWSVHNMDELYWQAVARLAKKADVKLSETILVSSSPKVISLLHKIGLSIAYRPADREFRSLVDKTIKILPEVLAIVE